MESSEWARAVMSCRRSSPIVGAAALVLSVARAELEAEHVEREQTFREHMRDRERWEQKAGKKLAGRKPQAPEQHELTQAKLNVTDPTAA